MLVIFSHPFQLLILNHPFLLLNLVHSFLWLNFRHTLLLLKLSPWLLLLILNRPLLLLKHKHPFYWWTATVSTSCVAEPRPSTSSVELQQSVSNTVPSNVVGDVEVLSFRHRDTDDTPTPSWKKFLFNMSQTFVGVAFILVISRVSNPYTFSIQS